MRIIRYLTALLLTVILSAADTAGYTILVVQLKDGRYDVYQLATKPKMTYDGSAMVLKTTDIETRYERTDVRNLNFGDEVTAISMPQRQNFRFAFDGSTATVSGLESGCLIRVFTAGGQLMKTVRQAADGKVGIDLGTLGKGTYIIDIGRQKTIKVMKR